MIIIILFLFGLGFWGTWAVTSDIQWGILALVCYEGCIYFKIELLEEKIKKEKT